MLLRARFWSWHWWKKPTLYPKSVWEWYYRNDVYWNGNVQDFIIVVYQSGPKCVANLVHVILCTNCGRVPYRSGTSFFFCPTPTWCRPIALLTTRDLGECQCCISSDKKTLLTRKASCRWQTRATLAKSLHGLHKSSGVVSCIARLPIDSVPMVSYYVLYSNCVCKMRRFGDTRLVKLPWPWKPGQGSLKVIESDTIR